VVRSGETLWQIAKDELGPNATNAQISATWPSIYQANRAIIGSNPNLIRPGQVLRLSG